MGQLNIEQRISNLEVHHARSILLVQYSLFVIRPARSKESFMRGYDTGGW